MRDVLVGQVPEVLRRELYALPALLGSRSSSWPTDVGFISPLVVWGAAALVFGDPHRRDRLDLNAPQPFRLGDPRRHSDALQRPTTPSSSCASAAPRRPTRSCRSCAGSPRAAGSPTSGSRTSRSTTTSSAAAARSTTRTAPSSPPSEAELKDARDRGPGPLGQPQLAALPRRRPAGRRRSRAAPHRRRDDERLLVATPPAGSTARTSPTPRRRGRRRAGPRDRQDRPVCPAARLRRRPTPPRRRGAPRARPTSPTTRSPSSSSPTRSPTRWTRRPGPATARATSTSASTSRSPSVVDRGRQRRLGRDLSREVVFCSRSGPPSQPWLEPDVNDRLEELAAAGRRVVVLAPIGFVSDHMEVVYDLDTEAAETAERVGLRSCGCPRSGSTRPSSPTSSTLLEERAAEARGEVVPTRGPDVRPSVCAPGCCPNLRQARPALCGSD